MSTKYLLPCRCGQQVVVEPRQAGQTVVCGCGQSLPVPGMLDMSALEPAAIEATRPSRGGGWGWGQRIVLLGVLLFSAAVIVGVWSYRTRPVPPIDMIDPDLVRQGYKNLPPPVSWHVWRIMKQGLDRRIDQRFADEMTIYRWKQGLGVILAVAGVALIGTGLAKGRRGLERGGDGERGRVGEGETTI